MDRYEADWGIVERGWRAHVLGEAPDKFASAPAAIAELKQKNGGTSDQFLEPFVVVDESGPVGPVRRPARACRK